jgi:hypothetical protein
MLTSDTIESNKASWRKIQDFVESFPDNETWKDWKEFMRSAIQKACDDRLNHYFRAGQSMQHIVFSTCERHGLENYDPEPPRVTVGHGKMGMFVASSRHNLWFSRPERETLVTADNIAFILKSYLESLWRETRPNEPVPFDT